MRRLRPFASPSMKKSTTIIHALLIAFLALSMVMSLPKLR